MTMYASMTPRDLSHDPHPRYDPAANPRPEYDHMQHNAPNPILTWFRAVIEDPKCGEFNQVVDDFLIYHIKGHGKQEHHARAVL